MTEYDQQVDFSDQKISKYNSAELQNLILHSLWKKAQEYCQAGLYEKWNGVLDMIYGELGGDVKPGSKDEEQFYKFTKDIAQIGPLTNKPIEGFNHKKGWSAEIKSRQYLVLLRKHIWLKRLQNHQGKGTAYKSVEDDWE